MMGSRPRLDVSRLRTGDGVPRARLAASQLRRHRRIVDAVVELAEKGGFDGVRLRDVAEVSEVEAVKAARAAYERARAST